MIRFSEDDAGYLAWIATHQDGFVLNVRRVSDPDYAVLHRATCHIIANDTQTPGAYTERQYRKERDPRRGFERSSSARRATRRVIFEAMQHLRIAALTAQPDHFADLQHLGILPGRAGHADLAVLEVFEDEFGVVGLDQGRKW